MTQEQVLRILLATDQEHIHVKDLSEMMGINKSATQQNLRKLLKEGVIKRVRIQGSSMVSYKINSMGVKRYGEAYGPKQV
jgi:predicted transcriptional regulator